MSIRGYPPGFTPFFFNFSNQFDLTLYIFVSHSQKTDSRAYPLKQ
ncbi:hypothetical protein M595_5551 [Lyngbya aestuarii BL J]|uniref:Uncharacterized protein n=1 Tax=Lyngbya aestuarii BL J TaxID=1348334 RepID=U7QBD2_9CYAN|nr:hypothetical protein M595_5551 [Lyngbya aestuarii BL J]